MNMRLTEKTFRVFFIIVFIMGTVWAPTTGVGASSALGLGNGLHAEYRNLGGTEVILTVHGEGPINHGWNGSCPDTNMYQNECGSWAGMFNSSSLFEEMLTGYIEAPATGTYEFHAWVDDYLQITINGVTQTADDLGGAGYSIVMDLAEGQLIPVTMYYKNRMGSANVGLYWTTPDATSEYVPKQYLYTELPNPVPGLTLEKSASPTNYSQVGDNINYSYLLTNTGTGTLSGPFTVTDNKTTATCPGNVAPASLNGTVLFDHFENGTLANYTSGTPAYVSGPAGFGQGVDMSSGAWMRYNVPGWYQWTGTYDPVGKAGSVDLWVYPKKYNIGLVNFNWVADNTPPGGGHILHLTINSEGKLRGSTWSAISGPALPEFPSGNTTIPLNQWTHVAYTWGEDGTRLFVNGVQDAFSPDNYYPALESTFYVYVPYWGDAGIGYIDEFRITSNSQTNFGALSLAPAETTTCFGSYTIAQGDIDNGSVTNTAQAHGFFGITPVDSNQDTAMATYGDPWLEVWYPEDDVQVVGWPLNTTVSLTIDNDFDINNGFLYQNNYPRGTEDRIYIDLSGAFDIGPGHVVTVSDAQFTRFHQITTMMVTGWDLTTDAVFGTAEPNSSLQVHAKNSDTDWVFRTVVTDGSGHWTANFSQPGVGESEQVLLDIRFRTFGAATQWGTLPGEGGQTHYAFYLPNPSFEAWVENDQIMGHQWTANSNVQIEIDDPGNGPGIDHTTSGVSDGSGNFSVFLNFDIVPGQQITLTSGQFLRTHTVTPLVITNVEPDTDKVYGKADPGTVEAWFCLGGNCMGDDRLSRFVVADSNGDWVADFSVPGPNPGEEITFNIVAGTNAEATQSDVDGDMTRANWNVPNPSFSARKNENQVHGYEWTLGSSVTLTIDDPDNGVGTDYTATQPVGVADWDPNQTFVRFDLGTFTLESGQLVTMTQGGTTKTHTVTNLIVTAVDPALDTVSGTAEPGSQVDVGHIYCDQNGCTGFRRVTADTNGNWTADFAHVGEDGDEQDIVDIKAGTNSEARQCDEDGECTTFGWHVPNPNLHVFLTQDRIEARDWPNGNVVTLTIDNPTTPQPVDYTTTRTMGPAPWNPNEVAAEFDLNGAYHYQVGDVIEVSDGTFTKTLTLENVEVTGIDPVTETISGTTDAGAEIEVNIHRSGAPYRLVTADGVGNWTVNFSVPWNDQGIYDLNAGLNGAAMRYDEDGDASRYDWRVPNPILQAYQDKDRVVVEEWPVGATVSLEIDDPSTTQTPDYTSSVVVTDWWIPVDFGDMYDLKAGDIVTGTDGTITKRVTVTSLTLGNVDPVTDTISGTSEPGSSVEVFTWNPRAQRRVVANGSGEWVADFSVPGNESWESDLSDIAPGDDGMIFQEDEDYDRTSYDWHIANPSVGIRTNDNRVEGWDWTLGSTVTVTVDDPGTTLSPDVTKTAVVYEADWNPGEFRFDVDLNGEYDIQPGDIVTATDGSTLKTTTVTVLAFTDIDVNTDIVTGTAAAGSSVAIWACDNNGCYNYSPDPVADGSGTWSADFTGLKDINFGTWIDSSQNDEDGDGTYYGMSTPNPRIAARLNENAIEAYEFEGNRTVTLQIDDPATPEPVDYTDSQIAVSNGGLYNTNLRFDLSGFTLAIGHIVTVSDGITTKTLTVEPLNLTGWDVAADTISGTASSQADIWLDANNDFGTVTRHFQADSSGNWTANYSVVGDEDFEQSTMDIVNGISGEVRVSDADGDTTSVSYMVYTPWIAPSSVPLVVGVTRDVNLKHPMYYSEDWSVLNLLYEPFYRVSQADSSLIPAAATGYTISPDSKVFTFTLRSDMLWSDGQPVTAQQYADGLLWLLDPATSPTDYGNSYASLLYDIQGAEDFNRGVTTDPNTVGIVALNSTTLQITAWRPTVHLPKILSLPGMIPVRKDLITLYGNAWVEPANFVGNGSFTLLEHDGTHLLFAKSPTYYNASQVHIAQLAMPIIPDTNEQFDAYKRGEIDTVLDAPQPALDDAGFNAERVYSAMPGIFTLGLNNLRVPTDDPLVRKALASAIDRNTLLSTVMLNTTWRQAATGVIPPEFPGYQGNAVGYGYNPTEAQNLLAQAGYPGGVGLPAIQLYGRPANQPWLEAIAEQWRTVLGVTVETHYRSDINQWLRDCINAGVANCDYNAVRSAWIVDYYDPQNILNDFYNPDVMWWAKVTGWENARYRELLDLIRAEQDPAQRIAYIQEAEQILVEDDAAVIPLFFSGRISLVKPGITTAFGNVPYYEQWNIAPVAVDDVYTATMETELNVGAESGVLANDIDTDVLTAIKVSDPAHGALTLHANGSFTYLPDAGYLGSDSFTYKASDGELESAVVTASIDIGKGAPPLMPSSFYGEIHIADNAPVEGNTVQAFVPGIPAAIASAVMTTYNGTLVYALDVPGDETFEGSTITFKINGRVAATAPWHSGTNMLLHLHPPQALAGGPYSAGEGEPVYLTGSANDWAGDAAIYQWDWDNDGLYDESGQNPVHVWSQFGVYTVGLKVTDAQSGEGMVALTVTVIDVPPTNVSAGGPYSAFVGQVITLTGSATCTSVDTCTYAWDLDNDGEFDDASGLTAVHSWTSAGSYTIGFRATDSDGNGVTATAPVTVTALTHSLVLVPGWNLVSFNVHPTDTSLAAVLASIAGKYDLVYAWDATGASSGSGNWLKADNIPMSQDTLQSLDETMGFWIHMTSAGTLQVSGSMPSSTGIAIWDNAGGWNLVGYPSAVNGALPAVLTDLGADYSLVYSYRAVDTADPWKLFDRTAPPYGNDLSQLSPGWGYWIRVSADHTWTVTYAP